MILCASALRLVPRAVPLRAVPLRVLSSSQMVSSLGEQDSSKGRTYSSAFGGLASTLGFASSTAFAAQADVSPAAASTEAELRALLLAKKTFFEQDVETTARRFIKHHKQRLAEGDTSGCLTDAEKAAYSLTAGS
jgi:hypothetical protein